MDEKSVHINELSILIPVYNTVCTEMVERLQAQAAVAGISYEIIAADDASPDRDTVARNEAVNRIEHCMFIAGEKNRGSAANRNFLAQKSRYPWLLFVDCDMCIPDDEYLMRYLTCATDADAINGGMDAGGSDKQMRGCLRYLYEKREEPRHTAAMRQQRPYHSFRSANFVIRRSAMLACPFDERFLRSGYEDVMLGKQLRQHGFRIKHIDNPLAMGEYEGNAAFMDKTERSLVRLHHFSKELNGYSRLLTIVNGIHLNSIKRLLGTLFLLLKTPLRMNLCSQHPVLRFYDIYRLGYYLRLLTENTGCRRILLT